MANDLTKRLYVGNVEVWESDLSKKRFSDAVPDVKIVERGIILPARRIDNVYRGGYAMMTLISSRAILRKRTIRAATSLYV